MIKKIMTDFNLEKSNGIDDLLQIREKHLIDLDNDKSEKALTELVEKAENVEQKAHLKKDNCLKQFAKGNTTDIKQCNEVLPVTKRLCTYKRQQDLMENKIEYNKR